MTDMTHPEELVRRYVAVWGEPDPDARREAVSALWADGGVEFVEAARYEGHDELCWRVAHAYDAFVGSGKYAVTAADDATTHGDIVTFTVQLEAGGEIDWAARVFLLVDPDGRIREDYQLTVKPLPT